MESKTNYTLVGTIVLLLLAGLITASLWLSIGFDRKKFNFYTVYMHESVSGLTDESPVRYNGVRVGLVTDIELSQFDPQQVKITIKVEEDTPVTTSTYATLITQGVTGTTYLGLAAKSASFIPLQKTPGEPYPIIPTRPSFFSQLEKNINEISLGFKRLVTAENTKNLRLALANIQLVTKELPHLTKQLEFGIKKFNTMAGSMSNAGKEVSITMQAGKEGIDKLSQQTIPPLIILLRRLDTIAANLENVSAQMRQNPGVLIRGTVQPKPGPGE